MKIKTTLPEERPAPAAPPTPLGTMDAGAAVRANGMKRGTRAIGRRGFLAISASTAVEFACLGSPVESSTPAPVRQLRAHPAGIQGALDAARAGDEIIIPNGSYRDSILHIPTLGTAKANVVVRAETEGEVLFAGRSGLRITGREIVVVGLSFHDCDPSFGIIVFEGSQSCRVTRCRIDRAVRGEAPGRRNAAIVFTRAASNNRLDHNRFTQIAWRNVAVQINRSALNDGPPAGNRIDHNVFRDVPESDGHETIQIGQDQRSFGQIVAKTLVDSNVFLRCHGDPEVISNKSSGNTYSSNLFVHCRGELTLRGGHDCIVDSNRFENCSRGIRVSGSRHSITNNVVCQPSSTGIRLASGMQDNPNGPNYPPVSDCVVSNNTVYEAGTISLEIGSRVGPALLPTIRPYSNRLARNILVGSAGRLLSDQSSGSNLVEANLLFSTGAELGAVGVGPIVEDPLFLAATQGDLRVTARDLLWSTELGQDPTRPLKIGAHGSVAAPTTYFGF